LSLTYYDEMHVNRELSKTSRRGEMREISEVRLALCFSTQGSERPAARWPAITDSLHHSLEFGEIGMIIGMMIL
jgi:hypothetical protein